MTTLHTWEDDDRISVTAWEDDGSLVGLAWCEAGPSRHPHEASVEVTPARRGEGIGTALLRALLEAARARGIRTLSWVQPADDLVVRRLVADAGAVCARRVEAGRARSAILVPPPA